MTNNPRPETGPAPLPPGVSIRIADWAEDGEALRTVRQAVFVREQGVPEALEWDGLDAPAVHFLALDGNAPIGCARLLGDGRIGRMAVLPAWRGRGIGAALLERVLAEARARGMTRLRLNAQATAVGFYERAGFHCVGEEFLDAGIPHYAMVLEHR
jgi:predicted GNAT family N-acyltransferase